MASVGNINKKCIENKNNGGHIAAIAAILLLVAVIALLCGYNTAAAIIAVISAFTAVMSGKIFSIGGVVPC